MPSPLSNVTCVATDIMTSRRPLQWRQFEAPHYTCLPSLSSLRAYFSRERVEGSCRPGDRDSSIGRLPWAWVASGRWVSPLVWSFPHPRPHHQQSPPGQHTPSFSQIFFNYNVMSRSLCRQYPVHFMTGQPEASSQNDQNSISKRGRITWYILGVIFQLLAWLHAYTDRVAFILEIQEWESSPFHRDYINDQKGTLSLKCFFESCCMFSGQKRPFASMVMTEANLVAERSLETPINNPLITH